MDFIGLSRMLQFSDFEWAKLFGMRPLSQASPYRHNR